MAKLHISKARVLYNTLCGRLIKGKGTVSTVKQLQSYPRRIQCVQCVKVAQSNE